MQLIEFYWTKVKQQLNNSGQIKQKIEKKKLLYPVVIQVSLVKKKTPMTVYMTKIIVIYLKSKKICLSTLMLQTYIYIYIYTFRQYIYKYPCKFTNMHCLFAGVRQIECLLKPSQPDSTVITLKLFILYFFFYILSFFSFNFLIFYQKSNKYFSLTFWFVFNNKKKKLVLFSANFFFCLFNCYFCL